MAYDFAAQQAFLSKLLGDPNTSTDDMFPLADRKQELNNGEIEFARDSEWIKEFATDVVADNKLALPADYLQLFTLIIDNKVVDGVMEIDLHQWERFQDNGATEPFFYIWEFSGVREMRFLAGSGLNGLTYKLYYIKKPTTDLDDDADESLVPTEYRKASVYYAAKELLEQIGKTKLSDRYEAKYQVYVAKAIIDGEKLFRKSNQPYPDLGPTQGELSSTDRQGGPGWPC